MVYMIMENARIANNTWRMQLTGDTGKFTRPGQFVQVQVPGFYLRRPISVCDWDEKSLTLIYKAVGRGTDAMTHLKTGETVDLLTGLGNGFAVKACKPLLLGGGVGVPPLYKLCKELIGQGMKPAVVLGFNTQPEIFLAEEFKALGADVTVTTVDGSAGVKGFVTHGAQSLTGTFDYVYACGPEPMLKAVFRLCAQTGVPGQLSLEERMACGFGSCMGCTIQVKSGAKRVCADGPVFETEELPW